MNARLEYPINARIESMRPSATLAMTARAKDRKRAGFPVISLSAGEPDFDTPVEIADAAVKAIRDGFTHYTANPGIPELREAICNKLNVDNGLEYQPGQILCSNGAKQSVAQAVHVLCGPGDEVLIPAPYWVSYPEMVRFAGAMPVEIRTSAESEYKVTASQLEDAITPSTRLLILCSPSNPTGSVYTPEEIRGLAVVLQRHPQVLVISDEIYEQITYDTEHLSIAAADGMAERTVTVNGFSKAYAMTGWRLGYMAAAEPIIKACGKLQSQLTSAPCSISQIAGLAALNMSKAPILEMVAAFRARRDYVLGRLAELTALKCPVPEGAFYVFPDVGAWLGARNPSGETIVDSEALCFHLLEAANLALVPGSAFGGPGGVRISYAASMADLEEAMSRLIAALSALETG